MSAARACGIKAAEGSGLPRVLPDRSSLEDITMAYTATGARADPPDRMSRKEKKVILASSLGTVFEWYDFYLYGSLSAVIAAQFFSA